MTQFRCKYCDSHLGDVTRNELIMGGGAFEKSVTMRCVECRRKNKWVKSTVEVSPLDPNEVAAIIKSSIAEAERKWFMTPPNTPPRRDSEIDAAEAEADKAIYEEMVKVRDEVKKSA